MSTENGQRDRFWKGAYNVVRRSPKAAVGTGMVLVLLVVAVLAPVISPHDPNLVELANRNRSPGAPHYLGTDQLGRDMLSRIIWGTRVSLLVGFVAVLIGMSLGILMGVAAGYFRGWIETAITRFMDIMICFPTVLLALAIIAILGPGIQNVMIAVGLTRAPRFARLVRGSVLSIRDIEFVEAARATGSGTPRILFGHILPNVLSGVVVFATLNVGSAILTEASLSFLGLGVPPPTATWGTMVAEGRRHILNAPWISLVPGFVILLTVLSLNFFGDGIRDVLDPRLRGERSTR